MIEQLNYFFKMICDRLLSDDTQNPDITNYGFNKLKDYVDSKIPSHMKFKMPFMFPELVVVLES